jgi:hypothetical protein
MRNQSSLFLPPIQLDFSWDNSALSCWDSSGSDEDFVIMRSAVAAAYHYWNKDLQEDDALASQQASGSRPGKGRNSNRGRTEGALRIDRDYFCRFHENAGIPDGPLFTEEEFRLRFRVSRNIYERVRMGLLAWEDKLFVERADACGVKSATTGQKMWIAFKALATGSAAEYLVDYGRLATSTNLLCLKKFCAGVVGMFENDWLHLPDESDLKRLTREYAELGFPGCMGAVDCASWYWDVCRVGWQGQCRGKSKHPKSISNGRM